MAIKIQDMVQRVRECGMIEKPLFRVFTDLTKALDMVDHRILPAKLEHYGVKGETLGFLVSNLRGRFQHVVYNRSE
jgi:hypothetical protein